MKTTLHLLLIGASLTLQAGAATVQFFSNSTASTPSESNSVGPNVVIVKNPGWSNPIAGSQWISYGNTGDPSTAGFFAPPNGTIVTFTQTFTLAATDLTTNGTVSLYADDSSSVVLNGHVLITEASGTGNTYSTCSDTTPNCTVLTTVVLPAMYLVSGSNSLQFAVAQRAGSSFGLDYAGSAGSSATPEPGTWASLGAGVSLLIALRKRKSLIGSNNKEDVRQ